MRVGFRRDDETFDEAQDRWIAEQNAERKVIRQYCNLHGYTDIEPFEVIRIVSDQCVEVRSMSAQKLPWKQEWYSGGFAGHCANQREQKWDIQSDEEGEVVRLRWSKAKGRWQYKDVRFVMSETPRKFYDYNF